MTRYLLSFIAIILLSTTVQSQDLREMLRKPDDNPMYRESKLYQKANQYYKKKRFKQAARIYARCLRKGIAHANVRYEYLNSLQGAHKLNKARRHIENFDSVKQTLYFDIYLAMTQIENHCFTAAQQTLIAGIKRPRNRTTQMDSLALGVAYSHLGYCKLFKQSLTIRKYDIASESRTCDFEGKLQDVDAMCCYYKALLYGLRDTTIRNNILKLRDLYRKFEPDYELPFDLGDFYTPPPKHKLTEDKVVLPYRNAFYIESLDGAEEVLFILDHSGSMEAKIHNNKGINSNRLEIMKAEMTYLLTELQSFHSDLPAGAISVGVNCEEQPKMMIPIDSNGIGEILFYLDSLESDGATPLNETLDRIPELFTHDSAQKVVFLFSDGMSSCKKWSSQASCEYYDRYAGMRIRFVIYSLVPDNHSHYGEYGVYECLAERSNGYLFYINGEYELDMVTTQTVAPTYRILAIPEFTGAKNRDALNILPQYRVDNNKARIRRKCDQLDPNKI